MGVARFAPQGLLYHADFINLLQSRGSNSTPVRFPIDIHFTLVNSTFYTKCVMPVGQACRRLNACPAGGALSPSNL